MDAIREVMSILAADADAICASQTPAAGGVQELTINGVLASGGAVSLSTAQHLSITFAADETGRVFTFTGTDRYGQTLVKTVSGTTPSTVVLTYNYETITSITTDDDTAGAITVGVAAAAESRWITFNNDVTPFDMSIACKRLSSPDFTYGVQITYDETQGIADEQAVKTYAHASLDGETSDQTGVQQSPVGAMRLTLSSFVAGTLDAAFIQAG